MSRSNLPRAFLPIMLVLAMIGPSAADSLEPLVPSAEESSLARGLQVLNKCLVCHTIRVGEPHAAGPNLYGVVGRAVGKVEGYKFSRTLRKSEAIWTRDLLNEFILAPQERFPRNRMAFAGLKNSFDRASLLKVLESLKD